jgi:hypothetical protein
MEQPCIFKPSNAWGCAKFTEKVFRSQPGDLNRKNAGHARLNCATIDVEIVATFPIFTTDPVRGSPAGKEQIMVDHYIQNMLGDNERIVLVTRQHAFVLFRAILLEIVVTLGVVIGIAWSYNRYPNTYTLVASLLVFIPVLSMVRDIIDWKDREYIVTNRRVIQIFGIFNKNVIDSSLEKVNDVKMTQSFFGRLFDYGDIEIMTASEQGINLFKRIGDPVKFKTSMLNAKEKVNFDETGSQVPLKGNVPALIAELDELRKKGIVTEVEFQTKKRELLAKM